MAKIKRRKEVAYQVLVASDGGRGLADGGVPVPQDDDADGDDGVGHEGADRHHVHQVLEVEEGGHEAGEQAGQDGGSKRRLELLLSVL